VNETYDLLAGRNQQAYLEYLETAILRIFQTPGIIDIRVHYNLLNPSQVRLTLVWQTLADWARFAESPECHMLNSELFKFATCIKIKLWVPSSVKLESKQTGKLSGKESLNLTKMDLKFTWD
jgi:hypothetical protein